MKKNKLVRWATIVVLVFLALSSCGGSNGDPSEVLTQNWEEIVEQAQGTTVNWAMWGGDQRINTWVDTVVARALAEQYDVTLNRIPMDAQVFVTKLSNEKEVGRGEGSLDLLWINGENFRRAKEEGLLLGPVHGLLPNMTLVDPVDGQYDFGTAIDGLEVPYGRAQFVFEYDSARISEPPSTFEELRQWIVNNPGRFTYPMAGDFTGSAFIRQLFYYTSGGYEQHLEPFDQQRFDQRSESLFQWLSDIEPYLWQEGRSYPSDKAQLDTLFERSEVDFNMSYSQGGAQGLILAGRYPETVRTFVIEGHSLGNIHFSAVPFNAPNPAGALVLANLLLEPEIQASKNDPANWGDFTVLDLSRLNDQQRSHFEALDLGPATLPLETLAENAVPEISSIYVEALEQAWQERILPR